MNKILFYNGKGNICYKRQFKADSDVDLKLFAETHLKIYGAKSYEIVRM